MEVQISPLHPGLLDCPSHVIPLCKGRWIEACFFITLYSSPGSVNESSVLVIMAVRFWDRPAILFLIITCENIANYDAIKILELLTHCCFCHMARSCIMKEGR